jgi:RHS repeat-associated protein
MRHRTVVNPIRFPGQYHDAETNLHYNYHRYYEPVAGRYVTSDPIGIDGGLNRYAYATNDPVNAIDPFGLQWGGRGDCAYYDALCEQTTSEGRRDSYACAAAECCRSFGEGLIDRCARKCLISNDRDCAPIECPDARSACRIAAHVLCYVECLKLPINISESCSGILFGK